MIAASLTVKLLVTSGAQLAVVIPLARVWLRVALERVVRRLLGTTRLAYSGLRMVAAKPNVEGERACFVALPLVIA
jgi:hypothetical protein